MKKILTIILLLIFLIICATPASANNGYLVITRLLGYVDLDTRQICFYDIVNEYCYYAADDVRVTIPKIPGPASLEDLATLISNNWPLTTMYRNVDGVITRISIMEGGGWWSVVVP